jgi:chromosome segregation ATPase
MASYSHEFESVNQPRQGGYVETKICEGDTSTSNETNQCAVRDLTELRESLQDCVKDLHEANAGIRAELQDAHGRRAEESRAILNAIKELALERKVITQMHERLRDFQEQFHEREVLQPIFRRLAAIASRVRTEIHSLQYALKQSATGLPLEVALAMRQVIQTRKADLVELEDCLAQYGVERFHSASDSFNHEAQFCAQRLIPGTHGHGCPPEDSQGHEGTQWH